MFLLIALFVTTVTATVQANAVSVSSIELDVYYESQCPDCYNFFVKQLLPTVTDLSEYIETYLVPYGNAKTNRTGDQVTFECQHGESECYLNKIHACALERFIGTSLQRVRLATCFFDYYKTPKKAGEMCSRKFGLKWSHINACAENEEGTKLMDKYGNITDNLNPPHTFVPTTAVNKYRGDTAFQDELASNLKGVLCTTLQKIAPKTCSA